MLFEVGNPLSHGDEGFAEQANVAAALRYMTSLQKQLTSFVPDAVGIFGSDRSKEISPAVLQEIDKSRCSRIQVVGVPTDSYNEDFIGDLTAVGTLVIPKMESDLEVKVGPKILFSFPD
eukprot:1943667-Prymnesium_polylepis.1